MRIRRVLKGSVCILGLMCLFIMLSAYGKAFADGAVSVEEINYETSTIKVKLGSGDTTLLISDGKQKKWETVISEPEGGYVYLDMSWISATKNYELSLKGDVNTTPVRVTIPMQNKNFKVTYSPLKGISFSGAADGSSIQWKKKESVTWKPFPNNAADFNSTLEGMIAKGATLVFRTAPKNGNGSDPGARASKEVTVSIKARASAPVMKIDDQKMTINLKKDMEFRYCDSTGTPTGNSWESVDKNEDRPLNSIAAAAMCSGGGTVAGTEVTIQFRMKATDKSQVSNITTVTIPGQKPLTTAAKDSIKLEYTSPSTVGLSVSVATDSAPYEYCIITQKDVEDGVTIDNVKELTWNSISDSKQVTITKSKAGDGSLIYVRKKAKGKLGEEDYELASPSYELSKLSYPLELSSQEDGLYWLSTISGVCRPENTGSYLTFNSYSAVNEVISEIQFVAYDSTTSFTTITLKSGTDTFKSVIRELTDEEKSKLPDGKEDYKYLITTTIMSTAAIDSLGTDDTKRELLLNFKQGNSELVKSTAEHGVAIYIHPKSVIKNPSQSEESAMNSRKIKKVSGDHGEYLTSFSRLYGSTFIYSRYSSDWKKCDASVFSFVVEIGTKNSPIVHSQGEFDSNERNITKLEYDGITFTEQDMRDNTYPCYVVNYYELNGKRYAIVTVDTWAMEKNSQIKDDCIEKVLNVYLSDGEVIKDQIKITYDKTAFVVADDKAAEASSGSWVITGPLNTEITTTTTVGGVPTTTTTLDDLGTVIWLKLKYPSATVNLLNVTFKGISICKNITKSGGYIKCEISKELMNRIIESYKTTGVSAFVQFTFDNGYVLSEGYQIIVNPY
ncbi:MAG: hypothetical protein IKP88_10705 [Lachnospiraceae bacterium]|nr:hypothetical protein [Lachnospiraceae bacterium]